MIYRITYRHGEDVRTDTIEADQMMIWEKDPYVMFYDNDSHRLKHVFAAGVWLIVDLLDPDQS